MFDDAHSKGLGGPPHPDHPRRCNATRRCGLRCQRWAIKGSKFCQFHGGRKTRGYWNQHVSRFYRRNLTQSLQEAIAESTGMKPDDQFNLMEELALMRDLAGRYVTVYSAALETGKQEAILASGELMSLALNQVATLCRTAASIHAEQKDKFSIHDLNYIIEQIVRISFDTFKNNELCNTFALRIREELDLKSNKAQGTTVTPDSIVAEMDKLSTGFGVDENGEV